MSLDYSPAGKVVEAFHNDDSFVRGLEGPVGSSKSSACCVELFTRAMEQAPHEGRRSTRFAVTRASYRELQSTTIETWMQWFPFAKLTWDSPILSQITLPMPDDTVLDMETMFFPIESAMEIEKLSSLEITGFWMNEARENPLALLQKLTERAGRYPPKRMGGGPTWRGGMLDTNMPDDDHWIYRLAEGSDAKLQAQIERIEAKMRSFGYLGDRQRLYRFFKQPGGLMEMPNGDLEPNPDAENVDNLDGGYAYYYRQAAGKSREWIKAQILAQYATVADGRPVYPEWNDDAHVGEVEYQPKLPLLLGFDYGLTPACAFAQLSPRGQLCVIDELCARDMGIQQFARDVVKPYLAINYPQARIRAFGDPAGLSRSQTDEKNCFQLLAEAGIACMPAQTNKFLGRREAVVRYLIASPDGKPGFALSPRCDTLRRGFNGRYCFRRIQMLGQDRFRDEPDDNEFTHIHDALQYVSLGTMFGTNDSAAPIKYPAMGVV